MDQYSRSIAMVAKATAQFSTPAKGAPAPSARPFCTVEHHLLTVHPPPFPSDAGGTSDDPQKS